MNTNSNRAVRIIGVPLELNPFLDDGNISAERAMELLLSAMGKSIL